MATRPDQEGGAIRARGWLGLDHVNVCDDPDDIAQFRQVMGLAVITWLGPEAAQAAGIRYQQDVMERRNPRAALIVGVTILATGLIFGGALGGEADPVGDDEGDWWIPAGSFLVGWLCLVISTKLYA